MKVNIIAVLFLLFPYLYTSIAYGEDSQSKGRRLALFIANQAYESPNELSTPINDAMKVAEALKKADFISLVYKDVTSKAQMEKVFDDFKGLINDGDTVLFYYAGHGSQKEGKSYLYSTQDEEGMDAQQVMRGLREKNKNGTNIIILDTCRLIENTSYKELQGDLVSVGGGNAMVVFSTKAGKNASDGEKGDKNGPFASALIDGIHRYHWKPLEDVLQEVGKAVNEDTHKEQQVYVYGWIGKEFCLSNCLGTQNITVTP